MFENKVVDLEQKTERIQKLLAKMIANMMQVGQEFQIRTNSFLFGLYKYYASDMPTVISNQDGTFILPSFCSLINEINNCANRSILIVHTATPMAASGHNGNNETLVGFSSSMGLSLFDEETNEIEISKSSYPIDIAIPRDINVKYNFQYVNVTNTTRSSLFLQNSFYVTANNASIHIELKPFNASIAYLLALKLGHVPIINATYADYNAFKIMCPSNLKEATTKRKENYLIHILLLHKVRF